MPWDLATDAAPAESVAAPRWRLLDEAGRLLGLAEPRPAGLLHPVVVLV
jgi:hypothetical protein